MSYAVLPPQSRAVLPGDAPTGMKSKSAQKAVPADLPFKTDNASSSNRAQKRGKLFSKQHEYNIGSPRPTHQNLTQQEMGKILKARLGREGRLVKENPAIESLCNVPALAQNESVKTPAQFGMHSHGDLFQQGMEALGLMAWRMVKTGTDATLRTPGAGSASTAGRQPEQTCKPGTDYITGSYRSATSLSEFEAAAEKNFVIRKSMLLAPGERPEHILVGDAHHSVQDVQSELQHLSGLALRDGNQKNKLLIESELVPPASMCYGVSPTVPRKTVSRMTGCIGIDSAEERARLQAEFVPPIRKAAKEVTSFLYSKSPPHVQKGLHRPDDLIPDSMKNHDTMVDRVNNLYTRTYSSLNPADQAQATVLMGKVQAATNAFDEESLSPQSLNARESYMGVERAKHVGPDHLTVEVVGDTHVENMADTVLAKHKSWVLDSKLHTNKKT